MPKFWSKYYIFSEIEIITQYSILQKILRNIRYYIN